MKQSRFFRRGLIGALLLLGSAAPFTFTSCEAEHAQVNITLNSDYTELVAAMKDSNKSLIEKLNMIEQAIKNGNADDKSAQNLLLEALKAINGTLEQKLAAIEEAINSQTTSLDTKLGLIQAAINGGFANNKTALDLIKEAIGTLNGTVDQKLAAIEQAIKSQTTTLDTKLGLIQAAIQTGLADNKTAIEQLKTAIESLKGSVDGIDSSIDDIVTSLNGLKGALDTDIAALLQGIIDSIDGIQDYSEILTAIKAAIENIGVDPDAYDAGAPAQAVDLDLPSGLKWASYNLGASKPEEAGDCFAWGETKPYYTKGHSQDEECTSWMTGKTGYNWASYFDTNDGGSTFETYALDKATKLKPEHDAATANWGGSWRMPTIEEQRELLTECNWEWAEVNGVSGYKVSSKSNSSNYIFLPAVGLWTDAKFKPYTGSWSNYWSSSLVSWVQTCAFYLRFNISGAEHNGADRFYGLSVRAVCP